MKKSIAIMALFFLAACSLPIVSMDKYLELKKQYDTTVEINQSNVAVCSKVYEDLQECVSLLELCVDNSACSEPTPKERSRGI